MRVFWMVLIASVWLSACKVSSENVTDVVVSGGDEVSVRILNPPTGPLARPCVNGAIGVLTYDFDAEVSGPDGIDEGINWSASAGEISSAGVWAVVPEDDNYVITATSAADPSEFANVYVSVEGDCTPASRTIELVPAGANGPAGTTLQTTAICRIGGVIVTSCNPWWHSSDDSRVSVNPNTGFITFVAPGSATVCVQWSQAEMEPRACYTFVSTSVAAPTISLSPLTLALRMPGCPLSGPSTGQLSFLVDGGAVSSGITWASGNSNVAVVSSTGAVTAVGVGTAIITGTNSQGSGSATVTVSACPAQASVTSVTATPDAAELFLGTCPATGNPTVQAVAVIEVTGGASQALSWDSNNDAVATVSSSGLITAVGVGTTTIVVSSVADPSRFDIIAVTVSNCPVAVEAEISITPATFTGTVGSSTNFSVTVTVPSGMETDYTAVISDPSCGTISQNGFTVTVAWTNACASVSVTVRLNADQSKTDTASGSVSSGIVICTIKVDGVVVSSYTLAVSGTKTVTAECTNQFGASFLPYWRSSDNSRVGVQANQTVNIGGIVFTAGPSATITGIAAGTARITAQAAITDVTAISTLDVTVQ